MRSRWCCLPMLAVMACATAGDPPAAAKDQVALLANADPKLAANKRLVFDMFRIIVEAGRHDLADRYIAADYIQHNPKIPNGRAAALEAMRGYESPKPVIDTIRHPLISIVAEGDMVVMMWVRELPVPGAAGEKYRTTRLDAFRIADGKVVEHWDDIRL